MAVLHALLTTFIIVTSLFQSRPLHAMSFHNLDQQLAQLISDTGIILHVSQEMFIVHINAPIRTNKATPLEQLHKEIMSM